MSTFAVPEAKLQLGHTDTVFSVCVSPDGKYALSGSWKGTIRYWNLTKGKLIYTVIISPEGSSLGRIPEGSISGSFQLTRELICFVELLEIVPPQRGLAFFFRPFLVLAKINGKDLSKLVGSKN